MLGRVFFMAGLLMAGLLVVVPAGAQATEPAEDGAPAPWKHLDGRNAGAVGTCSPDDDEDVTDCYLVRCEKGDLVFVMQAANLAEFGVRKITFEIGRYKQTIKLPAVKNEEQAISLAKEQKLLAALTSRSDWASLSTAGARLEYSTGFDLTGAATLISQLRGICRK
ncbi:hypothetical protein BJF92_14935 [Rhizobium rhizosphaerae]|uniref:Uncharacterized protein n=1 Tax=Xaviernesmea rhizosphaerae TaxID=1672749 RepID=A0A1Q9ACS1_9HYPH|nr:hypothetical protein [Xaviernesmea rhizosphaerae]OLP52698.1 hypothetical protein BJF92_14935 [Xaviernesmea rhizosphaerae]